MWPNQQQQPRPSIGARSDPVGHFGQNLPSLGLGSEGKLVVRASLTFLSVRPAGQSCCHPSPSLVKCSWRCPSSRCLSSGLDTQKTRGTPLGGTQAPGGCPDYDWLLLPLATYYSSQASRTPSCQPTTGLGRQLVARAGGCSPSLNPPFPEPRPGLGGAAPEWQGGKTLSVAPCLLLKVHIMNLDIITKIWLMQYA